MGAKRKRQPGGEPSWRGRDMETLLTGRGGKGRVSSGLITHEGDGRFTHTKLFPQMRLEAARLCSRALFGAQRITMAEIRRLAEGGTYDPETLDLLSGILAQVWIEVGHAFKTLALVEDARDSIAKTLLYHAGLGLRDPDVLKALVMQALKHHYPKRVV